MSYAGWLSLAGAYLLMSYIGGVIGVRHAMRREQLTLGPCDHFAYGLVWLISPLWVLPWAIGRVLSSGA